MTGGPPIPDVAVIGGGIIGAATAAFLAADGAAVTLIERSEIAAAASGRNSGVVQHPFDPVLAGLYHDSLALYRVLASEALAAAPFAIDEVPSGLLLIGAGDSAASTAADVERAWAAAYPDARPELVSGPALRSIEPSLADGLTACRLAIGFPVAPAAATRAYAAVAAARGARVVVGRSAGPVVRDGVAIGADVDGAFERAGAVVVAAGPWSAELLREVTRVPIAPVWGVVASLQLVHPPRHVLEELAVDIEPPQAGTTADGGDDGRRDPAVDFSLVTAAGLSALGSTFLAEEPDPAAFTERLRAGGARYVPEISGATIRGLRACARPVSADRRPLVGRVPGAERLFLAAGHGPWGISTGPATARMIADLVLGRPGGIPSELAPSRFGG